MEEPRQPERQLEQRGAKPQPAPAIYQIAARASIDPPEIGGVLIEVSHELSREQSRHLASALLDIPL